MPKTDITLPTVEELRSWVEEKPEGSDVAVCQSTSHCILAEFLSEKYPHLEIDVDFQAPSRQPPVRFWKDNIWVTVNNPGDESAEIDEELTFVDDALCQLLERFDHLSGMDCPVTREEVLTCFEENAHATS